MKEIEVRRLAPGVHAYLQFDGGWLVNNAGFVSGRRGTVLVDQVATIDRAKRLLQTAEAESGRPVRMLVNTHHHVDHTNGNCVVGEEVTILARAGTRNAMIAIGIPIEDFADYMTHIDWGGPTVRLPDLTVDAPSTLWVDDREIQLIPIEGPAHTRSDLAVWLPQEGVLFAGDLIFNGVTPLAVDGSISGWQRALNLLEALQPDVVVPGHGPLADAGVFEDVRRYLRFVQQAARDGLLAGRTPLEQAERTDLGEFAGLLDFERLVPNLFRAYAEAGHEVTIAPRVMLPAMVAYKGGLLESRC